MLTLTIIIIAATCIISYLAFTNQTLLENLIFEPIVIKEKNEWYRFITSGFIHADFQHLAFNMFTFYFFGRMWETTYIDESATSKLWYLFFYISAIGVSSIPSYLKNKEVYNYSSLGASGGVSAIVFSMILVMPWSTLYVFILPIPAIIYAFLYVGYSVYMGKKGGDNINHDAHLWGAAYGVVFSLIFRPQVIQVFLEEISHPKFRL